MLAELEVLEIYRIKISFQDQTLHHSIRGKSGDISKIYGVSARTIRDIWSRRTWAYVTVKLWSQEIERIPTKNVSLILVVISTAVFMIGNH